MNRPVYDSLENRQSRLARLHALLDADEAASRPPLRFSWFATISATLGALALFAAISSLAPLRADASAKTQSTFTSATLRADAGVRKASISRPDIALPADLTTPPISTPMIALVIDDIGPARAWSTMALDLPQPVTLAILPYTRDAPRWAARAQASGHEILLHMPMEPLGLEDPGPGALLKRLPTVQNRQRLLAALLRVPGVVGVNNHMGSRFTSCASCIGEVANILQNQGLIFLDSVTSQKSAAARVIGKAGVPIIRRDVFLDDLDTPAAIATQMKRAEALALRDGVTVVIAHPRPHSMAALQGWQDRLAAKGIRMVSLRTALVQRHANARGVKVRSVGL